MKLNAVMHEIWRENSFGFASCFVPVRILDTYIVSTGSIWDVSRMLSVSQINRGRATHKNSYNQILCLRAQNNTNRLV